jgi:hypothetical protein
MLELKNAGIREVSSQEAESVGGGQSQAESDGVGQGIITGSKYAGTGIAGAGGIAYFGGNTALAPILGATGAVVAAGGLVVGGEYLAAEYLTNSTGAAAYDVMANHLYDPTPAPGTTPDVSSTVHYPIEPTAGNSPGLALVDPGTATPTDPVTTTTVENNVATTTDNATGQVLGTSTIVIGTADPTPTVSLPPDAPTEPPVYGDGGDSGGDIGGGGSAEVFWSSHGDYQMGAESGG